MKKQPLQDVVKTEPSTETSEERVDEDAVEDAVDASETSPLLGPAGDEPVDDDCVFGGPTEPASSGPTGCSGSPAAYPALLLQDSALPLQDRALHPPEPALPPQDKHPPPPSASVAEDLVSLTDSSCSSPSSPATSEANLVSASPPPPPPALATPPPPTARTDPAASPRLAASPDLGKQLMTKSESTDSAFEATEQFEEDVKERETGTEHDGLKLAGKDSGHKVHIQIVDLATTTTLVTDARLDDKTTTTPTGDCDNVDKLSALSSCEQAPPKDIH